MNTKHKLVSVLAIVTLILFAGCGEPKTEKTENTKNSSDSKSKSDKATQKEKSKEKAPSDSEAKTRKFRFVYGATLKDVPKSAKVRVWLPVPQNNDHQTVEIVEQNPQGITGTESKYGNKTLYFETEGDDSGTVEFSTTYAIVRQEVKSGVESGKKLNDDQRKLFLAANANVPIDGKPLELLSDFEQASDPMVTSRSLYDLVDDHVKYDKSKPGYGTGDSNWVCDSRFGNCTDFHSLFISLARSQKIPARFEIGFPLPTERGEGKIGGYHCWALFFVDGKGWIPVDISEADKHPEMKEYYFGNLTENRVTFTTGRDLTLEPKQAGEPLNYLVYPYVEVDGKVWPNEKFELNFSYKDDVQQ